MNPLTNVKNLQKLNQRELELGLTNKKSWHDKYKDSAWIFVGGLPYDLTEGDVVCVFSQYGEIVNINMVRDQKTGKSKGFCFICFEDQRSTILSVDNLNGIKLLGRTLRVDHVEEYRKPKEHGDEDDLTKKIRTEGIAPKVPEMPMVTSTETTAGDKIQVKDKRKKKKQNEEKKKKRKKKESSDSESSSSSDSESDKKKVKVKKEKYDTRDSDYAAEALRGDRMRKGDRRRSFSPEDRQSYSSDGRYKQDRTSTRERNEYYESDRDRGSNNHRSEFDHRSDRYATEKGRGSDRMIDNALRERYRDSETSSYGRYDDYRSESSDRIRDRERNESRDRNRDRERERGDNRYESRDRYDRDRKYDGSDKYSDRNKVRYDRKERDRR